MSSRTLLAIVPLLNEAAALPDFDASIWAQEKHILPWGWRLKVLYVDDGSTDSTPEILTSLSAHNPQIRFLRLSRNFGHQAALHAGIEAADEDSDAVVILDGDGQHPVSLIPQMLRLHLGGMDVVRTSRIDDPNAGSLLKRWISRVFHGFLARVSDAQMPLDLTEFSLFGSPVLRALQRFEESHRYLRGLLTLVGFTSVILPIRMCPRSKGHSKYSYAKQLRLASDGVFSFSTLPLKACLLPGTVFICGAIVESAAMIRRLVLGLPIVPGWTSLMVIMLLGFGSTMLLFGVAGIYIGKIFEQVKNRPIYIIRSDSRNIQFSIAPTSSQEFEASSDLKNLKDAASWQSQ